MLPSVDAYVAKFNLLVNVKTYPTVDRSSKAHLHLYIVQRSSHSICSFKLYHYLQLYEHFSA